MAAASNFDITSLLGDNLTNNKNETIATQTLANAPAIGLYFSAHWCPPCRGFTPVLAKSYTTLKSDKNFEIVFISSDRDQAQYDEYLKEMPWLALPYPQRELKAKLAAKFKVSGIPTLIILDPSTGKVINAEGRGVVAQDPTGKNFPWKPPTFWSLMSGAKLVNNKQETKSIDDFKNHTIGLYFSAHWCGPCRMFTPQLIQSYNKLKAADKNFEIVFVSSDRDPTSFNKYFAEMPWLAVNFEDEEVREQLSSMCKVEGIPCLALVDGSTGNIYSKAGRASVSADPEGNNFPWLPELVPELTPATAGSINDTPAIVVFADNHDTTELKKNMEVIGKELQADAKAQEADAEINLFIAKQDGIVARVRQLTGSSAAVVVLLDIPAQACYVSDVKDLSEVTSDWLKQYLASYKAGSLTGKKEL